jgi:TonB family protein
LTLAPTAAVLALIGMRGWAAWDEVVYDFDVPPRLLEAAKPVPVEHPLGVGAGAIFEVELAIGRDGRVETVTVVRSVPSLDDAVLRTACAWRFTPARRQGVPVRTLARSSVVFDGRFLRGESGPPVGGVARPGLAGVGTDQEPVACPR